MFKGICANRRRVHSSIFHVVSRIEHDITLISESLDELDSTFLSGERDLSGNSRNSLGEHCGEIFVVHGEEEELSVLHKGKGL